MGLPRPPRHPTVVPTRHADARRAPRYNFKMPARATIYPPQGCEDLPPEICQVLTRDLSSGGICFLFPMPLFESQRIEMEMPDGRCFTLAICRVTRLRDGCFVVGCRFAKITGPGHQR